MDRLANCFIACNYDHSHLDQRPAASLPDVVDYSELGSYRAKDGLPEAGYIWLMATIPSTSVSCPLCGVAWSLKNCHDYHRLMEDIEWPLDNFTGQFLGQFRHHLTQITCAEHMIDPQTIIRNDRFIDLRPDPEYDLLKVNQFGWVGPHDNITDDYIIQTGDVCKVHRYRYYHPACYAAELAIQTEQTFRALFLAASYDPSYLTMTAVANQYGSQSYRGPWFEVQTHVGMIRIGWRKRVIEIDWSSTGRDLLSLFQDVDHTKGSTFIHAWNTEQAVDYLSRIHRATTA